MKRKKAMNIVFNRKQLIKRSRLTAAVFIIVFIVSSCKKIVPEEITNDSYTQVVTMAGNGNMIDGGFLDGNGRSSAFKSPSGIVTDAAGNLYIVDGSNHCIRKMTPSGVVSTIAGNGEIGYVDGIGKAARFSYPNGITIDQAGNLYVCDSGNDAIRKITPAGVVSTYAGNGPGYEDGSITTAKFYNPLGITADKAGNLYVVDGFNYLIRKITPGGMVTRIAGVPNRFKTFFEPYTGPATDLVLGRSLFGIAVDAIGNVYIPDQSNNVIWQLTPNGMASSWAGTGTKPSPTTTAYRDGKKGLAKFSQPNDVTCDLQGNIYVADLSNNRIRKIDLNGIVSTVAGNGMAEDQDGIIPHTKVCRPNGITVDAAGNVYFSTAYNNIRKLETITMVNNPKNTWNNPQSWGNPK